MHTTNGTFGPKVDKGVQLQLQLQQVNDMSINAEVSVPTNIKFNRSVDPKDDFAHLQDYRLVPMVDGQRNT